MTEDEVVARINAFIEEAGSRAITDWYVGVASDVEQNLFNEHHVDREKDKWICFEVTGAWGARRVERYYQTAGFDGRTMDRNRWNRVDERYRAAGCDGANDNNERSAVYVYAFLKSEYTVPDSGGANQVFSDFSDRG